MFYLYVLKSEKDGKLYIGSTKDLQRRIFEHGRGKVLSTKHRRPLVIVYTEEFANKSEVEARERYFKGGGKAHAILIELIKIGLERGLS